jgi:hypothetical protein
MTTQIVEFAYVNRRSPSSWRVSGEGAEPVLRRQGTVIASPAFCRF